MKKFRQKKKEKLITYLIKSCELFNLNEKDSLYAINNVLGINNISRRTYYDYKKNKVYRKGIFKRLKGSCYDTLDVKLVILDIELDDWKFSKNTDKLIGSQFPGKKNLLYDKKRQEVLLKSRMSKFTSIIDASNDEKRSCLNNWIRTPKNAIVKEQYVRCGKNNCYLCPHGPYYYAYWTEFKNNKIVNMKKYLGIYDPHQVPFLSPYHI